MCANYALMLILVLVILPLIFTNKFFERLSTILIVVTCIAGISGMFQRYVC